MTYASLFRNYGDQLEQVGEEREALTFVFCQLKGWTYTDFILHQGKAPSQADQELLEKIVCQLKQHVPAQYILGKAHFHGMDLLVDSRVLIPRPETEELVDLILAENPAEHLTVLDVGTGSGAIALSLARHRPNWKVTALDISPEALSLAQENAQQQGLDVTFLQSDMLTGLTKSVDLIVSNPPYIAEEDKDEVGQNVLAAEPHLALFAKENGLALYRQLAKQAPAHLNKEGKIYLEIGYKQGQAVQDLFAQAFPDKQVRVLKDSFGKDRMVVVS